MGASGDQTITIAPCREACPAGIDVPRYIRHIRNRDFDMALAVIREKIPFPAVCGYACVHPCESKCARIQYDEAIAIRMLKRAAYEKSGGVLAYERKAKPTGKRVAIIGAGPCGLTAAYYLAGLGHAVSVFEARPRAGGMLRYGIPEYRLPNDILDREIAMIASRGVEIVTDAPVSSARELLAKGYDAVLAASGAWRAVKMGIEGEASLPVMDGLAFLQEVNSGVRQRHRQESHRGRRREHRHRCGAGRRPDGGEDPSRLPPEPCGDAGLPGGSRGGGRGRGAH